MNASVLCIVLLVSCCLASDSPVIGILGESVEDGCVTFKELLHDKRVKENGAVSCFDAVYVKWIESGGGRVVPLRHNTSKEDLRDLMGQLNGILLTGGELNLSFAEAYVQTAKEILSLATSNHKNYFPLWGTCQGFQLLNILIANNLSVLSSGFDSEDLSLSLNYTSSAINSRLFGSLPTQIREVLGSQAVTYNYHRDGISEVTFYSTPAIYEFFTSLSTNVDRKGKEFISTVEAKEWPIWATQWHPERPQFEFENKGGPAHTYEAIMANQYISAFFINEARKNNNQFKSYSDLESKLIYNYSPLYSGGSEQVYVF
eukprot:TRINITY_DN10084_c0_g1_i1.p1 TRINITY_DN10084_c0_g1~~TRINITY_DN10084_c0_g1_i1.p1  ORF type:complete len:316 (-),score=40.60 TRINITY_DN10084_c0_g1_i1:45-992(-)